MISLRHWSVRHAGFLERSYAQLWRLAMVFEPAWRRLGYVSHATSIVLSRQRLRGTTDAADFITASLGPA